MCFRTVTENAWSWNKNVWREQVMEFLCCKITTTLNVLWTSGYRQTPVTQTPRNTLTRLEQTDANCTGILLVWNKGKWGLSHKLTLTTAYQDCKYLSDITRSTAFPKNSRLHSIHRLAPLSTCWETTCEKHVKAGRGHAVGVPPHPGRTCCRNTAPHRRRAVLLSC